jgi:hypothetical protein
MQSWDTLPGKIRILQDLQGRVLLQLVDKHDREDLPDEQLLP